ncbi:MAG TPA: DsbA family protein, partial [Candidatus Binataceae bacterium]|nr:DsbA family protein [Candidatus Binataceae bacterium]
MPRVVIPIFFDYASTLCYVAWRIVRELEPELGFDALWKGVPIALRDHRFIAGRAITDLERQKVLMVAAETGIAVAPLERWIDSSNALEGSELARDAGVFTEYHEAVFRAVFESRADISAPAILDEIAARAGLDPIKFRQDLESRRMAPRLE